VEVNHLSKTPNYFTLHRWDLNIKMHHTKMGYNDVKCIEMAEDKVAGFVTMIRAMNNNGGREDGDGELTEH
jgi:hypothetical protein